MKKLAYGLLSLSFLFVSCKKEETQPISTQGAIRFEVPPHFPAPIYDLSSNPITPAGFELGKALFYDGILSRDGTVSCGSCHQQGSAFTQHGHDLSHGIDDKLTRRNAQPIQNLAWERFFMWDGGVFHLDLFPIVPIENPNEMDETGENVLRKLRESSTYSAMFEKAFGTKEINSLRFLQALSQFQLMCISANSKYDKWTLGKAQLTATENEGKQIFEQKCSNCHSGVLQTDRSFRNNGLSISRNPNDKGRYEITQKEEDKYKFKVPSLRNIAFTSPYMHDGRFRTLRQVLDHYDSGVEDSPTLDTLLKKDGTLGIPLSEDEKNKIIEFLQTLSDEEFIRNPLLAEF
jgi:cytochrome c peroxidase